MERTQGHAARPKLRNTSAIFSLLEGEMGVAEDPFVIDLIVAAASGALATISSPVEEDVQRFGVILYILPIDGNGLVEITHVRMGVNGRNQVFKSRCDKDNKPVAMPVYLGPWVSLD
ncbi:hypothetical protein A7U60_g4742 [Sanghuangporus baumii]|uniref:Uncharacterized protein n=1 Tax=Sanghuangporus baumii TaxID=108892 RepID=A0A9Q5HY83_SANBA|nr:hypothetical protein A7U60_g4742 [Sanghuangporus baumii]